MQDLSSLQGEQLAMQWHIMNEMAHRSLPTARDGVSTFSMPSTHMSTPMNTPAPAQTSEQFANSWSQFPPTPPPTRPWLKTEYFPQHLTASMVASHHLNRGSDDVGPVPFDFSIKLDMLLGAFFADSAKGAQRIGQALDPTELAEFRKIVEPFACKEADLGMIIESIERIKALQAFEPFRKLDTNVDARILRFLNLIDRSAGAFIKSQLHGLETRMTLVAATSYVKGQMIEECIADVFEITSNARATLRSEHLPALYHTMLGRDYCITGGPLALISHDCIPNCEIVVDTSGVASLRTLNEIKNSEILTAANAGVSLPCDCASCLFAPSGESTRSSSGTELSSMGLGINMHPLPFRQESSMDQTNVLKNWNAFSSALPHDTPSLANESSGSPQDLEEEMRVHRSSISTPESAMTSPIRTSFMDSQSTFVSPVSSLSLTDRTRSPPKRPALTPFTPIMTPQVNEAPTTGADRKGLHFRSASSPYLFQDVKQETASQFLTENLLLAGCSSSLGAGPSRNGSNRNHRRAQTGLPLDGRRRKTILEPNTGIVIKERGLFERLLTILRLSPDAPSALEHGQLVAEFRLMKDYLDKALVETVPRQSAHGTNLTHEGGDITSVNELRFPALDLSKPPEWLLVRGVALMDMAHAENRVLAGLSFYLDWHLALYHDKMILYTSSPGYSNQPRLGKHDLHRKLIQDYDQVRLAHPELRLREVRGWDEMRRRLQVARRMIKLTDELGRALLISGLVSRRMLEQASEAEFSLLLRIVESHKDAFTWLVLESTKNHEDVISGLALLDQLFLIKTS